MTENLQLYNRWKKMLFNGKSEGTDSRNKTDLKLNKKAKICRIGSDSLAIYHWEKGMRGEFEIWSQGLKETNMS